MDFSSISSESRLGKLLRLPLRLIPPSFHVPILQGRLRGSWWVAGSSSHGCWLGSYEHAKRVTFEQTVREGDVVCDVGAHVGFYTLLSSVLVGPGGKVFAFEPVPRNLKYLRRHIGMNRLVNVTVVEAAVTDHSGEGSFEEQPDTTQGRLSEGGSLLVPTVSLDELWLAGKVPTPRVIKIDVEGGEMSVLAGARSLLEARRPILFLSTHGPEVHGECLRFLRHCGYVVRALDGRPVQEALELLAVFPA
jgi:FkbM family methyltransferase